MKRIFTLLLSGLLLPAIAFSQNCTLSGDADFCTACAGLINTTTGVINGVIVVPNNSGDETLPATCDFGAGPVPLVLGAVTLDVRTNANLLIDDAVGIQTGVTSITVTGAGNATLTSAGSTFGSQTNSDPSFTDLQNALDACAANPSCTSIGDAVTALPVSLVAYTIRQDKQDLVLNWVVSAETDHDFYLLEHATDGRNFSELTRLEGRHNVGRSQETHYVYRHTAAAAGQHYYRLWQQDLDGTRSLLGIRSAEVVPAGGTRIYPNPVRGGEALTLVLPEGTTAQTARLYSTIGREVATFPLLVGQRTNELSLPENLLPGMYLLKLDQRTVRLLVR